MCFVISVQNQIIKQKVLKDSYAEVTFSGQNFLDIGKSVLHVRALTVDNETLLTIQEHQNYNIKWYVFFAVIFLYALVYLYIFTRYWIKHLKYKNSHNHGLHLSGEAPRPKRYFHGGLQVNPVVGKRNRMGIFNATATYGRGFKSTNVDDQCSIRIFTGGFADSKTAHNRLLREVEVYMKEKGYSSHEVISTVRKNFPLSYFEYIVKFERK
jgi:hypothetical protein